jgi:uncharacterized protein YutD
MKQCPKCAWKSYFNTEPICGKARQNLRDLDIAGEIFKEYKELDCLYFINRKRDRTVYVTVEDGQVDRFQDLIHEYQALGCSKRVLEIKRGISRGWQESVDKWDGRDRKREF